MNITYVNDAMLPQLMELENAYFSSPWSESSMISEINAEGGIFTAAFEGERVTGFCCVRVSFEESELYQIAVDDNFRRRGIGQKLLRDAMERAAAGGAETMLLEVRANNAGAIALYEKLGFTQIARRKNYYEKPREDALIMQAHLNVKVIEC